ncbi:MAG: cyanoexosortase C [Leptolyngbyaceae cyanobacterium SM1_4_3]|nr:cyanoexosortase C [Leptolyngbyaceae cyanobacterium SM1_4_3]NJN89256.1 cyanoexosortase C [Leptolyngbyaceae cyanobacterium SL_5_14]
MKRNKQSKQTILNLVSEGTRTGHGRIVLCGVLVGLCCFVLWLGRLLLAASKGSAIALMAIAVGLGLWELWKQRHQVQKLIAPPEDRLLGHVLILSGVTLLPFLAAENWSRSVIFWAIMFGIACSCWGVSFFRLYPLPTFLITLGLFPHPNKVAGVVWRLLTPPDVLERLMAWSGSLALRGIGQPAIATDTVVSLPGGAVTVAWGCNGFNMALEMAAATLLLGLFLKLSRSKIILLMAIAIVLALIFNVPRIMLLTMASVYWGQESFEFWHGSWGGQIFSMILFTVYYYIVMGVANRKPKRSQVQ